jgi:dTDP-4-dehydrorhamnose 3,5-epimerase
VQQVKRIETGLPGVCIVEPHVFVDNRGWFMETYSQIEMQNIGINCTFIQDNQSYSAQKGVLRGIHFQKMPKSQAKLIRCICGAILDVAVDLRKGSPTYLQWVEEELNEENKRMLFIPKGFGHGIVTLKDNTVVIYKVDELFSREYERSIRFDDPKIHIEWNIENPILSPKDRNAPLLEDCDLNFFYEEKTP